MTAPAAALPTPQYRDRKATTKIILHASHTVPGEKADLTNFLTVEGRRRGLLEVGYHVIIFATGKVVECRNIKSVGSHTRWHNADSIGVCLEGGLREDPEDPSGFSPTDNFTLDQREALRHLVAWWRGHFEGELPVVAHTDLRSHTPREGRVACPPFTKENKTLWTSL